MCAEYYSASFGVGFQNGKSVEVMLCRCLGKEESTFVVIFIPSISDEY